MKRVEIKTVLRSCQRGDAEAKNKSERRGKERQKDEEETGRKDRRRRREAQPGFVLITGAGEAEESRDFCSLDFRFGSNAIFTYQIKPLAQTVRSEWGRHS